MLQCIVLYLKYCYKAERNQTPSVLVLDGTGPPGLTSISICRETKERRRRKGEKRMGGSRNNILRGHSAWKQIMHWDKIHNNCKLLCSCRLLFVSPSSPPPTTGSASSVDHGRASMPWVCSLEHSVLQEWSLFNSLPPDARQKGPPGYGGEQKRGESRKGR